MNDSTKAELNRFQSIAQVDGDSSNEKNENVLPVDELLSASCKEGNKLEEIYGHIFTCYKCINASVDKILYFLGILYNEYGVSKEECDNVWKSVYRLYMSREMVFQQSIMLSEIEQKLKGGE